MKNSGKSFGQVVGFLIAALKAEAERVGKAAKAQEEMAERLRESKDPEAQRYWWCKVGPVKDVVLPDGADSPMRGAVMRMFHNLTGKLPAVVFSGWNGKLTPGQQEVLDNQEMRAGRAVDGAHRAEAARREDRYTPKGRRLTQIVIELMERLQAERALVIDLTPLIEDAHALKAEIDELRREDADEEAES